MFVKTPIRHLSRAVATLAAMLPALSLALLLAPLPATLPAQDAGRAGEVPAAMSAIRRADLERDLHAMASEGMRGREGGTLDELRASFWVAEMYQKIGLVPMGSDGTYFQWFNMTRTRVSTTASRIAIAGQALAAFGDIIPLGVVPSEVTGAVLWLEDVRDSTTDVRGRIVAARVLAPDPSSIRPTSYPASVRYVDAAVAGMTRALARRGAAAILLVADAKSDAAFDDFAVMRARGSYDVDDAAPRFAGQPRHVAPPPALGEGATPAYLVRAAMATTLTRGPDASLSVRLERFEAPSLNVIGAVRGTDPVLRNEYVLYSSHQDANGVRFVVDGDSVWAGADDNGSVSVAQFAAARAFVRQPARRSILFIHHGSEERGLLGSRYHAAHPVVPLSQIVAVLNGDMIGRNTPDSASLLGAQPPHRNSTELVEMALRANALTGKFALDSLWDRPTHPEGWYFRSDHVPYARLEIPSLMYSTNLHDDYHTTRDTPDRIDYGKLTRMTQWMYLTGWFVANAPKRPAIDPGFKLER